MRLRSLLFYLALSKLWWCLKRLVFQSMNYLQLPRKSVADNLKSAYEGNLQFAKINSKLEYQEAFEIAQKIEDIHKPLYMRLVLHQWPRFDRLHPLKHGEIYWLNMMLCGVSQAFEDDFLGLRNLTLCPEDAELLVETEGFQNWRTI